MREARQGAAGGVGGRVSLEAASPHTGTHLVEEEDLLCGEGARPVLENVQQHLLGELRVLLDELRHAVRELLVVQVDVLHLVQRQQRLHQERLVLLLERKREAVDDRAEDLQ